MKKLTEGKNCDNSVIVCIKSKLKLKQWLFDKKLMLQVLDEIFMDPLSEDDVEDLLEEDYSDSDEYSPELDEEVPNEVTDARNEPVSSTSNQSFGFHRTDRSIEIADQTFYLTQSQYTDAGPTSLSADPITPGAWQGSHWSANF